MADPSREVEKSRSREVEKSRSREVEKSRSREVAGRLRKLLARVNWAHFRLSKTALLTLLAIVVLGATSMWFYAARDARGRTARLTADAWYYHAYLPSLVFDQDLDFTDEYKTTNNWYRLGKTPTGRQANVFGIGPAINELPFFMLGHGLAKHGSDRSDGFSRPEVELSLYASLLFSLGAVFFAARLLARRFERPLGAATIALAVALGGPVIFYAVRQPGYAHPFAAFWIAWLVDHWDRGFSDKLGETPRSTRYWIGFGLLLGAAALARPQLIMWTVLAGYAAQSDISRARQSSVDARQMMNIVFSWALGALCALLVFLPQLLAWKALNGTFLAAPQGQGFMRWGESMWLETLFSSRNGLFPWAPLYAIGVVGLIVGLHRHARICSALLLGVFLQAYVNGAVWDWWAGGSFGGRRFDSCYVAFAFGLGVLLLGAYQFALAKWWKRVARVALTASVAVACLCLVLANLNFAKTKSGPTVRIYGGKAARHIMGHKSGRVGEVAAAVSGLSNLPVRAVFAWRYDVDINVYDKLVGIHSLGELFPGLNSFTGKTREPIPLDPNHLSVQGLRKTEDGAIVVAPNGRFRFLVGLNRKGPVALQIVFGAPLSKPPSVRVNGNKRIAEKANAQSYQVSLGDYHRGTNSLRIEVAPGTRIVSAELRAGDGPNF